MAAVRRMRTSASISGLNTQNAPNYKSLKMLEEKRMSNDTDEDFDQSEFHTKLFLEILPAVRLLDQPCQQVLANGTIMDQKLVLSRDAIALSYLKLDAMIDQIPLIEVVRVEKIEGGDGNSFEVETAAGGYNSGRTYHFILQPAPEAQDKSCDQAIAIIQTAIKAAMKRSKKSFLSVAQRACRAFYDHPYVQIFIAWLIAANFGVVLAQSQLQPEPGSELDYRLAWVDSIFTYIFIFELSLNIFGHFFWDFVRDGWNIFDFIVVSISIVSVLNLAIPGLSILRASRAFRVMRLAGKLQSLKRIITAIAISILPVLNAFFIGFIVVCIFAVLGVEVYKERAPEDFGTFVRAFYTLWLVLAFGQWVESLTVFDAEYNLDIGVLLYLIFVVIVVMWIFLQVIVAVLLDNFIQATAAYKAEEDKKHFKVVEASDDIFNPLIPLLKELSYLFDTSEDLTRGLRRLFRILDFDNTKYLNFTKLQEGMKKLKIKPPVKLTEKDFSSMTDKGKLCRHDGTITFEHFEVIMRKELKHWIQRELTEVMALSSDQWQQNVMMQTLRLLLLEHDALSAQSDSVKDMPRKLNSLEHHLTDKMVSANKATEARFLLRMEHVLKVFVKQGGSTGAAVAEMLAALRTCDSDVLLGPRPEQPHLKRRRARVKIPGMQQTRASYNGIGSKGGGNIGRGEYGEENGEVDLDDVSVGNGDSVSEERHESDEGDARRSEYEESNEGDARRSEYEVLNEGDARRSEYEVLNEGDARRSEYEVLNEGDARRSEYEVLNEGDARRSEYYESNVSLNRSVVVEEYPDASQVFYRIQNLFEELDTTNTTA